MSAVGDEELRSVYARAQRGEAVSCGMKWRAPGFAPGVPLLPPELFPITTFPWYAGRLLDRLPGYALEAPLLEYVHVNSVTGAAGLVGEGQSKPETDLPATRLVCTA